MKYHKYPDKFSSYEPCYFFLGGKGTHYEGGVRVPMIAWWPTIIPPSAVSNTVVTTMDWFNTFIELAGGNITEKNLIVDGKSLIDVLANDTKESKHDMIPFYCNGLLIAVRYKQYKIYFYKQQELSQKLRDQLCYNGLPSMDLYLGWPCNKATILEQPQIYDVESDPGELYLLSGHDNILHEISRLIEALIDTVDVDNVQLFDQKYASKSLVPCCNPPYCTCG